MRNLTARALVVGIAIAAIGCDDGTGPIPVANTAAVRVVHASPGAPEARIFVNGELVGSRIGYGQATGYFDIDTAGTLDLRHAINGATLASTTFGFGSGDLSTFYVTGPSGAMTLGAAPDTGAIPAAGTAKLRAIHTAPTAPAIDVYLRQPDFPTPFQLLFPFDFETVSQYQQAPPGIWEVFVSTSGMMDTLATTGPLVMSEGQARTVLLVSTVSDTLQFVVLQDRT